jgi:hypothetical protein
MHPEDIKAGLRKKFGSLFAFEDALELPRKSVSDFLRGRPNQRVASAISAALNIPQADLSDTNGNGLATHRLNAGAK